MSVAGETLASEVFPRCREVSEVPDEQLMTPEQVAERLQVKPFTIREWLRLGKMKGIRLAGKVWRVRPSDLEEFLRRGESEER